MEELQTHKQTKHTDKQANQATKQSDNNFYFREKKHITNTHKQHPKLRKRDRNTNNFHKIHTQKNKQTHKTLA